MGNTPKAGPRTCFYIPVGQFDENGYIPSVVTEGEASHAPLTGNGEHAAPWYWGKTYEEAQRVCAERNAELGLTYQDVLQIVYSSMLVSPNAFGLTSDQDAPVDPAVWGKPFPGRPGYVTGQCGHAVAGSEWEAGCRYCEHCGEDDDDYRDEDG
jgi:hypothetical protein